jgi:Fe-Mn family superoxide dismutase
MKKFFVMLGALSLPLSAQTPPSTQQQSVATKSEFKAKDYSKLIGMQGFSDEALKLHFKLYEGYVKNTNTMLDLLAQASAEGRDRTPTYAEIKRRLMWEYDGMRLHEYYFDNLGGSGTELGMNSQLANKISSDFGSVEQWKKDFIATGAMRGIGWAVLYYDPVACKLLNVWINEHDLGHLTGGTPLLIMDVFEHAYLLDYGIDRAKYIDAFFNNLKWPVVEKRFADEMKRYSSDVKTS